LTAKFWYNGKLSNSPTLEIAPDDPGLIYGATAFTTMRVYGGHLDHPLTYWSGHCQRLKATLAAFQWPEPDWDLVRQGAHILSHTWPVIRITIFPDGRELILGRNLPPELVTKQSEGIRAAVVSGPEFERWLPHRKSGNYLGSYLALQEAQRLGATEAILIDKDGNWLETSTGNLWGWGDGSWWTPPLEEGILPGLMREQMMGWLLAFGERVQEEPWSEPVVARLEAIGHSNSAIELVPLREILTPKGTISRPPQHPAWEKWRRFFSPHPPNSQIKLT